MSEFPALADDARQSLHPLAGRVEFVVGRSADADLPTTDTSCSRRQFRLVNENGEWLLEHLSASNPTYLDGQPVDGRQPLAHGAVVWAGNSRFRYLERPDSPSVGDAAQATMVPVSSGPVPPLAGRDVTVVSSGSGHAADGVARLGGPVPLDGLILIGREAGRAQVVLPHVHVSRLHAQIQAVGGRKAVLTDLRSANGTYVNGRRVTGPTDLRPGDRIDVGPYSLAYTGATLVPQSREDNVELVARDLVRRVGDPSGGEKVLLDGVTLVVRPREFVCVIGPSGSGKSTLLSAMSARVPADDGRVTINGKDLYVGFDALKQDLVVVPQRDVLHEPLTVDQSLWYTAKLRLPPDTTEAECNRAIDAVLDAVGLAEHRATPIRNLSGGQRKRASLANELLGKPTLLFLDEVTSGLDEQTDRDMMALFRSLADDGKTVVGVTHTLANVERSCHLVAILAAGGRLAFYGPPGEALKYFGVDRLGDVYERLAARPPAEWKERFAASPLYSRYIDARLPLDSDNDEEPVPPPSVPASELVTAGVRQAGLVAGRHLAVLRGDPGTGGLLAAQAVVVAGLLVLMFGDLTGIKSIFEEARRTVVLTYFLAVACFWFGCSNAAKELVKERQIYFRERDFNLGIGAYYAAKFGILTVISCVQALVVWAVVAALCHPGNSTVGTAILLMMLATAGTAFGLAISGIAPSEDVAATAVPLVLLPQIILADAVAPLTGLAELLGKVGVSCYWGVRGLNAVLPEETARAAGVDQHSVLLSLLILGVQIAVTVAIGVGALFVEARRHQRVGMAVAAWIRSTRTDWERRIRGTDSVSSESPKGP